jgi:5-methylcytosine-specific restriction enzyme A
VKDKASCTNNRYSGANLTHEEIIEGRRLLKLHKFRERKRRIVNRKKESVLKATGLLLCEACSFDFAAVYGKLGEGFAECHHRLPLAESDAEAPTRLEDLAIVCANCHRMLHRSRPMMKVEELRSVILQRRAER